MPVDYRDPTIVVAVIRAYIRQIVDSGAGAILDELHRQGAVTYGLRYDERGDVIELTARAKDGPERVFVTTSPPPRAEPAPIVAKKPPRLS